MMWDNGDGMGWGMMLWGGIMMVLFWAVIIGLIVWAVQSVTRRDHHHDDETGVWTSGRRATNIARERYARGDIDKEEFERIMSALERRPPANAGI